MRAIVTCEACRHRQWLVRPIDRPESFHVICHRCERVLQVAVTPDHLATAVTLGTTGGDPGGTGGEAGSERPWPGGPDTLGRGRNLGGWSAPLV